jgi:hypothetical protein
VQLPKIIVRHLHQDRPVHQVFQDQKERLVREERPENVDLKAQLVKREIKVIKEIRGILDHRVHKEKKVFYAFKLNF